jgi:hypothetical protein
MARRRRARPGLSTRPLRAFLATLSPYPVQVHRIGGALQIALERRLSGGRRAFVSIALSRVELWTLRREMRRVVLERRVRDAVWALERFVDEPLEAAGGIDA